MNLTKKILPMKIDVVFKKFFTNEDNSDLLASFLSSVLKIEESKIKKIQILNPEQTPNHTDLKFGKVDLKLDLNGKTIIIEMQIANQKDFKQRVLYYWSQAYINNLCKSNEYGELKETISINILNFNLFDCKECHSSFRIMENKRHELLNDQLRIDFLELPKLSDQINKNNKLLLWMKFLKSETEEELIDLAESGNKAIEKAVITLKEMSEDDTLREEAWMRNKEEHDRASALGNAKREGIAIGEKRGISIGEQRGINIGIKKGKIDLAKSLLDQGVSEEVILKATGLSREELTNNK